MGTFTAQILVGDSHPNHGGIIPSHMLFLSENDRPAWILKSIGLWGEEKAGKTVTWIPTIENMLEDALLMISLYIMKDKELIRMANQCFKNKLKNRIELYDDISKEDLENLYKKNRELNRRFMIALSVFNGSTIENQLNIFKKYSMDIMVLKTKYYRAYSEWTQNTIIEGTLE